MKRLYLLFMAAILGATGALAEVALDSASYAAGYQFALMTTMNQNEMMQSDEDFKEFIKGLECYADFVSLKNDTSYLTGVTMAPSMIMTDIMTDSTLITDIEMSRFHPCILSGLREVADGKIGLPADTIAAREILDKYGANPTPDYDSQCKYYTATGIMAPFSHDVQTIFDDMTRCPGRAINRQMVAKGMTDVIKSMFLEEKTAYDLGRSMAFVISFNNFITGISFDFPSYIAGVKAALGLGPQPLSEKQIRQILFPDDSLKYHVDWTVTAARVAGRNAPCSQTFDDLLKKAGLDNTDSSELIVETPDTYYRVYNEIMKEAENYKLPTGYKWFCINNNAITTAGIMETAGSFTAKVQEAEVGADAGYPYVSWTFDDAAAAKWADFTGANTGKCVVLEINGLPVCSPRINTQIDGGTCRLDILSTENILQILDGAREVNDQKDLHAIEVIEVE